MKVEVAVLGSPSLIVFIVSGCKATLNLNILGCTIRGVHVLCIYSHAR